MSGHPFLEQAALSFAKYGDHRSLQWWLFFQPNTFAFLSVFLVLMALGGGLSDRNWWLLLYAAVLAATIVRYFMLAVADSKSGSGRLSWPTFWWWLAIVAEFVGLIVWAIVAGSSGH